eukprot:scaffold17604_cov122-Isochrysis_galbana.AAC.2
MQRTCLNTASSSPRVPRTPTTENARDSSRLDSLPLPSVSAATNERQRRASKRLRPGGGATCGDVVVAVGRARTPCAGGPHAGTPACGVADAQ